MYAFALFLIFVLPTVAMTLMTIGLIDDQISTKYGTKRHLFGGLQCLAIVLISALGQIL